MERLSASDAMFLQIEEPTHRIHYGAVYRFNGPAPSPDELEARVAPRVGRFPRLRQRVVRVPLDIARPVFVDDHGFDPRRHLSRVTLPPPGDEDGLRAAAGQFFSEPLDMDRPAWELRLVDGFADDRFALIAKVHHVYADAVSFGSFVIELVSDDAGDEPPAQWAPRPTPGRPRLLADAVADSIRTPLRLARGQKLVPLVKACASGVAAAARTLRIVEPAPRSRLNQGPGGREREVNWVRASTAELHEIANALGATLNTVVLTVVAGGVARYLERHGEQQEKLVALMPISMRAPEESGLGNRVASLFPRLPLRERDPARRIDLIARGISEMLMSGRAAGVAALKTIGDVAPPAFMRWLIRRTYRRPDFNLMATTVVFPHAPPTLHGAVLDEVIPCVHLSAWHGVGVGMTALGDAAMFGLITDRTRIPDGRDLADDFAAELEALRQAAAERAEPVGAAGGAE